LRETSQNYLSTSSQHPRVKRNPRGLPRIHRVQSLWTRTPRTRRLCSPCSRAMVRMRLRPWTQSQPPPRGGLVGQVPRLDGSRGASLESVRGQAHRHDGQIIHPRRWRAVQARRVRRLAAVHTHPPEARAPPRHPRGHVRPPRGAAHPREQRIPPGLLLAHRGRRRQRDWGANSTPARPISQRTPSIRFLSHGRSPCGG
jgi:hypothetical protein